MTVVLPDPAVLQRMQKDCANRLHMFCLLHNVRLSLRGDGGAESSIDRIADTLHQLHGTFALAAVAAEQVTPQMRMRHLLGVYGVDVRSR